MLLPEPYFQDYVFKLKETLNLRSGPFQHHLPWTLQLHFFQIKPTCLLELCRAGGGSHSFHVSQLFICHLPEQVPQSPWCSCQQDMASPSLTKGIFPDLGAPTKHNSYQLGLQSAFASFRGRNRVWTEPPPLLQPPHVILFFRALCPAF